MSCCIFHICGDFNDGNDDDDDYDDDDDDDDDDDEDDDDYNGHLVSWSGLERVESLANALILIIRPDLINCIDFQVLSGRN